MAALNGVQPNDVQPDIVIFDEFQKRRTTPGD
jgi:hypothetical protein